MYQKSSDLRKHLIISIYIDFLRFYFPFFCIHWLMGYIIRIDILRVLQPLVVKDFGGYRRLARTVGTGNHNQDWTVVSGGHFSSYL